MMLKFSRLVISILCCLSYVIEAAAQQKDFTQYVDPLIGTAHCRWFFFTPGALPFGMAKPAPSTNGSYGNAHGWDATGYDYRHNSIEGFANIHEFQVGGIVFAPLTGALVTVPGKLETPENGYRSLFDRNDEKATTGYYSVLLKKYNVKAELTATPRVAFHRYHFPGDKQAHILFDIGNKQGESGEVKDAQVSITPDGRIEGYVITRPVYVLKYQQGADVRMYFSAVVDKKPIAFGTFKGEQSFPNQKEVSGKGSGLYLSFDSSAQAITIKAGLSYTSVENARLNLQSEASTLSFDQAKQQSYKTWNEHLGRIDVETNKKEDKVKFYTGLYHALLGRGLASDVNGAYPKNDGGIGRIPADPKSGQPAFHHYNSDAIWGAFWNLTQLWAIAYPEYYSAYVNSQLQIYKDAGWLADGIANSKFVSGVGTNFVSLTMAAAYMCGIRDFDIKAAYEASRKNELEGKNRPFGAGKMDVERFVKNGYVDHQDKGQGGGELWQYSASHTLEYSFSTYAVAQWAKALGKQEDYQQLIRLSKGWEHLYDPQLKLIRPKLANGKFIDNFKPGEAWRGFQEGNSWQYTFYVPHDPKTLVAKVGIQSFNSRLDSIFSTSQKDAFGGGTKIDAFAGLEGLYNHGNQPNQHTSWLFNFSGKPSLTQKWVRAICNDFYGTEGIHGYGYGQDEDQGQLGAWYAIASMGLFDVKGLTDLNPSLGLGSPLFDRVTIKLNKKYYKGSTFEILAPGNSAEKVYVKKFILNGKELHTPFVNFKDVTNGGVLKIERSSVAKDQY